MRINTPSYGLGGPASPGKHSVERQQNNGANNGGNKAGRLTFTVPSKKPSQKTCDDGTCNAQEHRHKQSTGIPSRHDKLRDGTYDQTDHNHSQEMHCGPPSLLVIDADIRWNRVRREIQELCGANYISGSRVLTWNVVLCVTSCYFGRGESYRLLLMLTGCVSPRWHVQQVTFWSPTGKTPVPVNCELICRTSRIILRAISLRGLRSHS